MTPGEQKLADGIALIYERMALDELRAEHGAGRPMVSDTELERRLQSVKEREAIRDRQRELDAQADAQALASMPSGKRKRLEAVVLRTKEMVQQLNSTT